MRALIVDDERLARNEIRRLLGRHSEIQIAGEAANAQEARWEINRLTPDLLFLDVQMPGEDGFDLLASLEAVPLVVFTTAHDVHALRAFDVDALDYLVKPIDARRLARTVARVLATSERARGTVVDAALSRSRADEMVADRLRGLIEEELRDGEPTLERLAAKLYMSARTLHRRLVAEGTSFRRVLTEVRREHAERYLRERRVSINEIGFLLGFSEASAFQRAFKRWTGRPPHAYRQEHAPLSAA